MVGPVILAAGALALFLFMRSKSGAVLPLGFSGDAQRSAIVTASSGREYIVISWPARADGASYHFAALKSAPDTHFVGYLQDAQEQREVFRIKAPTDAEKRALASDFGIPFGT